jgi:hypothetical protein
LHPSKSSSRNEPPDALTMSRPIRVELPALVPLQPCTNDPLQCSDRQRNGFLNVKADREIISTIVSFRDETTFNEKR